MPLNSFDTLPSIYPPIRRARFAKIYDYQGNKFFDFYLNQGSIILGHHSTPLSKSLKNHLSLGVPFSGQHLKKQVQNSVLKFYPQYQEVTFFFSTPNLLSFLEKKLKHPILNLGYKTLRKEASLHQEPFLLLSPAIANGFPMCALLSKKPVFLQEDPIPDIFYQSAKTTLSEVKKVFFKKEINTLLTPYQKDIVLYGHGIFKIKGLSLNQKVATYLKEKKILISPQQEYFFLAKQTEPHQIAYLFKVLKKMP